VETRCYRGAYGVPLKEPLKEGDGSLRDPNEGQADDKAGLRLVQSLGSRGRSLAIVASNPELCRLCDRREAIYGICSSNGCLGVRGVSHASEYRFFFHVLS
jgi:hypothetical protein